MDQAAEPNAPPIPVLPLRAESAWRPLVVGAAIFSALSVFAAVTSRGFLEADGCTHFIMARFAFQEPHYLINVWGRPFCTFIYAIGASIGDRQTGLIAVRLTSLLLALSVAFATYRIAVNQGYRHPALAFIFVLAQPLFFLHSFSELTEIPFAFLLVLAFWAYQKKQFLAMTLLAGLLPLSRPEGFGFLILAALALIAHRRWTWLLLLPVPLLMWDYSGWVLYGRPGPWWRWLIDNWPYAAESLYQRGYLIHFVVLLPMVVGPLIFPALWVGIWRSFREPLTCLSSIKSQERGRKQRLPATSKIKNLPHPQRLQLLIALIPLMILIGHSLLYWRGKMASNGELRYMLTVSPFWALLAAKGWDWVFESTGWRRPILWAGLAALLPALSHAYYRVLPLRLDRDWLEAEKIAQWYQHSDLAKDYPNIACSHPAIWYFLDRSPSGECTYEWHKRTIANPPKGTCLIWDPIYGVYNSDAERSIPLEKIRQAGWVWHRQGLIQALGFVKAFTTPFDNQWQLFLSPRNDRGQPVPVVVWRFLTSSDPLPYVPNQGMSDQSLANEPGQAIWQTTTKPESSDWRAPAAQK